MNIEKLEIRNRIELNTKLIKAYHKMQGLIEALSKKEIPSEILSSINADIKSLNSFSGTEKELTKILRKTYSKILAFVEKELKFVAKRHFLSLWMVFGLLAGVVFSSVFDNFGFMGMGISIGMLIGIIVGTNLDKKAEEEGKQLELESVQYLA